MSVTINVAGNQSGAVQLARVRVSTTPLQKGERAGKQWGEDQDFRCSNNALSDQSVQCEFITWVIQPDARTAEEIVFDVWVDIEGKEDNTAAKDMSHGTTTRRLIELHSPKRGYYLATRKNMTIAPYCVAIWEQPAR